IWMERAGVIEWATRNWSMACTAERIKTSRTGHLQKNEQRDFKCNGMPESLSPQTTCRKRPVLGDAALERCNKHSIFIRGFSRGGHAFDFFRRRGKPCSRLCGPREFFTIFAIRNLLGHVREHRFFLLLLRLRLLQHKTEHFLRHRSIPYGRKGLPVQTRRPVFAQRSDMARSAVPLIGSEPIGGEN